MRDIPKMPSKLRSRGHRAAVAHGTRRTRDAASPLLVHRGPAYISRVRILACLASLLIVACGSDDPADVAGDYSVAVTNRDNGCELAGWEEGATASNIPVTIVQDGSAATATVGGFSAILVTALLGGADFRGTVDGDELALERMGTVPGARQSCAYTFNGTIDATIDGDLVTGSITYRAATNGSPDCGALTGCASVQDFNGNRPPR